MDNPISLLNPATVLTDADVLPIVNGGETKKVSIATIKAQTNVNADWNATSGVAQILNKPTIPAEQVNSDWNATTGKALILNKPTIPSAQVNSDWNATSGLAQILNKPTIPTSATFVPYTGATANVDLGEFQVKAGQYQYDLTPTGTAGVGITRWNATLGITETTLLGGNTVLKNGFDTVARIVNKSGVNLTKAGYQVVKVTSAQGGRLAVNLAQANNDNNSVDTFGIACENTTNNQEGYIMTFGQLEEINTTGSLQSETWLDGDVLYLSPTVAGRITNIKPTGLTGHIVVLGYVEYSHAIHGSIYVKIMNGWELDELHNVNIVTPLENQALVYDATLELWQNKTVLNSDVNERNNGYTISHEFTNSLTNGVFVPTAIASGSVSTASTQFDADHYGVVTLTSSATINSGVYIANSASTATIFLGKLSTNLQTDCIFKLPATVDASSPIRFGFTVGSITVADFTSGVYFEITNATVAVGKNTNASVSSSTSSYAMTVDLWYHFRVKVVSLSLIRYEIYLMNGTQVFSQTLATNIPTNIVLNGMFITTHGVASAANLVVLDYIGITLPPMNRGALT